MVKVTLRHGENWTTIEFPCSEQELQTRVDRLHGGHSDDMELFVSAVHFPKELLVLQDRFVNLDELNYLGRRLAGFWGDEASRFAEAVKLEAASSVREMINIVCNLNRYVLITDVSDPGKVGQEYIFQTEGGYRQTIRRIPSMQLLA